MFLFLTFTEPPLNAITIMPTPRVDCVPAIDIYNYLYRKDPIYYAFYFSLISREIHYMVVDWLLSNTSSFDLNNRELMHLINKNASLFTNRIIHSTPFG